MLVHRETFLPEHCRTVSVVLNGGFHSLIVNNPSLEIQQFDSGLVQADLGLVVSERELHFEGLTHRDYDPKFFLTATEEYGGENIDIASLNPDKFPSISNCFFLPRTTSFGHLIFEILPRLYLWRLLNLPDLPIAIPGNYPKRFASLIQAIVAPGKVNLVEPSSFYRIDDTVLIPPCPLRRGRDRQLYLSMEAWAYVRSSIRRLYWTRTEQKRFYISRGTVRWRRVTNEAAIISTLEEQGFTTVDFSQMHWTDQFATAMNCEAAMGALGSHMLIGAFMPPNADLAIAYPPGTALNYQAYLPLISGVEVTAFRARAMSAPSQNFGYLNVDVEVPTAALKDWATRISAAKIWQGPTLDSQSPSEGIAGADS